MYSVYQHWDPLKVCVVGRSYNPGFYSFIKNDKVRSVFERIARETEEDYQKLITLLESFDIKIIRPKVSDDYTKYVMANGKIAPPPMTPRDYSIMLGDDFYFRAGNNLKYLQDKWPVVRGDSWPESAPTSYEQAQQLPQFILDELDKLDISIYPLNKFDAYTWSELMDHVASQGNPCHIDVDEHLTNINSAQYTRIGRDIYIGTEAYGQDKSAQIKWLNANLPQYRWHKVDTGGHSDATFCPVKPGLIVSLHDIPSYAETFPGWEVVYLPGQSWDAVKPFLDIKNKNDGKWWVPGEELNDEFTDFVESWMSNWMGYVEETVFDVNMLVIDEHNVVVNNHNDKVFEAFARHDITPHVINFRHRFFWDGGWHCNTSDLHRIGNQNDYFPDRD